MKPTPERFLLGTPYTDKDGKRHAFRRHRPSGRPCIEVRTADGMLLDSKTVGASQVADYLKGLS